MASLRLENRSFNVLKGGLVVQKRIVPLLFLAMMLIGLASCVKDTKQDRESTNVLPREKTLYLVGFQWGSPSSFNPFNDWPSWPVRPEFNLMYEHLCSYNSLTGDVEPLIGQLYEKNEIFVSVLVNPEAQWSDGTPLTAKDVKFSYEIGKKYLNLPTAYVDGFVGDVIIDTVIVITKVAEDGAITTTVLPQLDTIIVQDTIVGTALGAKAEVQERVTLYVDKERRNNPLVLVDLLSTIPIYPKHVFSKLLAEHNGSIEDVQSLQLDKGEDHVVSGPYNLFAYGLDKIVIKRRDNYWGNKALYAGRQAGPEYIVHPIYKGNSHASSALKHGHLDVSANFMPRIWLKKSRGVKTWFDGAPYYRAGSIPLFIPNTTKKPLNDKRFRRAMAMSINYKKVAKLAVSGYTPELNSGLILPFAEEKKYYIQEDVDAYGATGYNISKAKKVLSEAGYKAYRDKDGDLLYTTGPEGDTLPTLFIMAPSGWSDFESVIRLSVTTMRQAGIDVREGFVDGTKYWPARESGDFDIIMDTPSAKLTKSMPWSRFGTVMSGEKWRPVGEKMKENIGRWNAPDSPNYLPEVDSLLRLIPLMSDEAQISEAYRTLNRIFMEEQPAIPVVYRPEEFYQFSTNVWSGFATEENPYAPPHVPTAGAGRKMLWNIHPVTTNEGK